MAQHRDLGPASIVLAIESATSQASVALLAGERVLAERSSDVGRHHSETLLPMIDEIFRESGCSLVEVEGFAISIGPGAFTSLRIGLSTVKGLCFGSTRPVIAVSTLRALAASALRAVIASESQVLVPVLDARRGEVYAAAYRCDPASRALGKEVLAPCVLTPDELRTALPEGGCLVGEGCAVVRDQLERSAPGRFDGVLGAAVRCEATMVGWLALADLQAGLGVDAAALVPRYVRRAEAEVQRTRMRFE